MKMRLIQLQIIQVLLATVLLLTILACTRNTAEEIPSENDMVSEQDFLSPPESAKPWVYYWWLKGNVSKELITRDLEEMHNKGIGGFLLFDSRGYWDDYHGRTGHIPVPLEIKHEFMSPEWREMVKFAMQEASRLGLKMSINLANTGGSLRGPWDMKEDGPKQLIWTAADITGPAKVETRIGRPADKKYFKEVALIAVRMEPGGEPVESRQSIDLNEEWSTVTTPSEDADVTLEVIDLSNHLENENLQWNAPNGDWRIIRYGYHVIGEEGGVDILNADAVTKYFNLMGSEILKDAGHLAGETLTHFYNVSWEGGQPDWTVGFEKQFRELRGYEINRFLPILAGMSMEDNSLNERFMRDYLKTVSECFTENCYQTIGQLCHDQGIQWHSENGGPWPREAPMFKEADQLAFWGTNDMPQGEFWSDSPDILHKKSNVRYTAMAAHTYGRPLISVEAFTHMTRHWTMYPAYLKSFADINFIDGANFFIWHTFTASPLEVGKPGYEYFAGTHINPNVTWFNKAGDFFKYLARNQYMLRKGKYVADYCCYVNDKNYVTWGRGNEWNTLSTLAPVKGTSYDLLSSEVITDRLSVKDGQLVLPDGMSYKLLVIDPDAEVIPAEVLKKIRELVNNGATLLLGEIIPESAPGINNYRKNDKDIKRLAEELWGTGNSQKQVRSLGKGTIYTGYKLNEVLAEMNILPDFEGPFDYIHRRSSHADIYFVSGTGNAVCTFNVEGKTPEIWNPVTGKTSKAAAYSPTDDGRTQVTLNLPENGSAFIVFREKTEKNYITNITGPETPVLASTVEDQSEFNFWKTGKYRFTNSNGQSKELNISLSSPLSLSGSWKIIFEPATGADEMELTDEQLIPWNEYNDKNIKYFAGTATYHQTFELNSEQANAKVRLHLENIHDIARVWVNGQDLGILWTRPWKVDLTGACKTGINELRIEVTNCWSNRLIGDAGLPEEERTVSTNVRLVRDRKEYSRGHQATSADDPLMPSGIAGPVYIEFGKLEKVSF